MTKKNPFGMMGTLDTHAFYKIGGSTQKFGLDGSGNATNTASVKWDSFKSIEMFFVVEYMLMQGMDFSKGKFGFSARWLASFTSSAVELAPDGVQPRMYGTNKSEGSVVVGASARLAESKPDAKAPFVEMAVTVVAGHEDEGVPIGFQKGPISVGTSIGGSKGGSGSELALRINLDMARPKVSAQPIIDRVLPSLLTPAPILFKEDEDTLSSQSTRELHDWVNKVKDHQYLGALISLGTVPLEIQAFASTTGGAKYNKAETDRRLDSVKKVLKSSQFFGSSTLKFNAKSHGMEKADGKGAKNGFNRRVEIKVEHSKLKTAAERFLAKQLIP